MKVFHTWVMVRRSFDEQVRKKYKYRSTTVSAENAAGSSFLYIENSQHQSFKNTFKKNDRVDLPCHDNYMKKQGNLNIAMTPPAQLEIVLVAQQRRRGLWTMFSLFAIYIVFDCFGN